jgi:hypothetical protein
MRYTLPVLEAAHLIATPEYPLRASALPKINECPASVFLSEAYWAPDDLAEDTGGEAAQTGNLVHAGAQAFHDLRGTPEEREEAGLAALEAARLKFPGGDARRAVKIFRAYAADPQNSEAKVLKNEMKVMASIAPAPWDVTRQPVVIRGTLDQVRLDSDGVPRVYDIKTGKKFYGSIALDHYMTQQAAYTLAAHQTWGEEFKAAGLPQVEPGALICTDGYFRPSGRAIWHHKWAFDDIELILQNVVNQVAAARMKRLGFAPSTDACMWCEHKTFSSCKAFYKDHVL